MKVRLVYWFTVGLLVLAQFQDHRWKGLEVFNWDAGGYFSYLPATFLYHDPGRVDSLAHLVQLNLPPDHIPHGQLEALGIRRLPNGRFLTKYSLGVALGELPWFWGAHWFARLHGDPLTGFSQPYQQAAMLAGLAYACLGLWVLRQVLRRYYSDDVVAWTLAGIALATNFFVYASYEAAAAHAVLFLWQAALLACTAAWYATPRRRWAVGIGLFWGLAVLVRPTEALYALVPLGWGLHQRAAWQARLALWGKHKYHLLLAAGVAGMVLSLQLLFWRVVAGHWMMDGYAGEHFDFAHPHILEGLFSFRKGWLLYSPLLVMVLLVGLPRLPRFVPAAVPVLGLLLPAVVYLTFSWGQWWYGGGFGARPLVSLYPLLALALGAVLTERRRPFALAVRGVLLACLLLNLWQTWQYAGGVLQGDGTTSELYRQRFFWRKFPPAPPAW